MRPEHGTGPGAIVWAAGAGCPGGPGARVDAIPAGDAPLAPRLPHAAGGEALDPRPPLAVACGPHGQIVIAGTDPGTSGDSLIVQGRATGPFRTLERFAGTVQPTSLGTAWLGDVALAGLSRSAPSGLFVRIERFFDDELGPAMPVEEGDRATAVTVAMDFRSDAVAAWAQGGRIMVRPLPAHGPSHPVTALGPAGEDPHLALLISDDYRSMVMWSDRRGGETSIYLDYSAPGLTFGAPRLVERFQDPSGPAPSASPLLVRLSSESVMAAWAGVQDGRWVVRTAPIDEHGLRAVSTIAAPGGGALLDALAAGPRNEAMLLFTEPAAEGQTLLGARGVDQAPDRTAFSTPVPIATGTIEAPALAMDPDSDRAVAAWRGSGGALYWSLGRPPAGG